MCYFKSFIYSIEKESFFAQENVDSHSRLAEIYKCNDDKVIKFEMLIETFFNSPTEWNFTIDTMPILNTEKEKDILVRCFNSLLCDYILRSVDAWTMEGTKRNKINSSRIFFSKDVEKQYNILFENYEISRHQYDNCESDYMQKDKISNYIKVLTAINNKKEKTILQKELNRVIKNLKEATAQKEEAFNVMTSFAMNNSRYEYAIKPLTREELQTTIDGCYSYIMRS